MPSEDVAVTILPANPCARSFSAVLAVLCLLSPAAAEQPNILFLFADDQCYETVHALGYDLIETPHLDRLVEEGLTFTHAYNPGSWSPAVCVPSRTMLNTGRQLWNAHRLRGDLHEEVEEGRFWSQRLQQAGYETYFTGKWHVVDAQWGQIPVEAAFDHVVNVRPGMPQDTAEGYNRPVEGEPDPWCPSDPAFGGFWEGGRHWSEVLADDAVAFLEQAAGREAPFFMYLAFNAPHDPRQSPQEYVDKYPLERVRLPESFLPVYPYHEEIGCPPDLRDERLAPFPRTPYAVKVHRQEYYAIISHMDTQIGRILDALERTGQAEDTIVIYTADHGLAVGRHGLLGKQNLYDHSVRVPFMITGPGVPAGERNSAPVYLQDIVPTTLEWAGLEVPEDVDFRSLLPLIRAESAVHYDAVYGAYLDLQRSITLDGFKLILYPAIGRYRLYHLEEDPQELTDLAEREKHRDVVVRLFGRLVELQEELGDPLDLRTLFPGLSVVRCR